MLPNHIESKATYAALPEKRKQFLQKEHDFFVERLKSKFVPKARHATSESAAPGNISNIVAAKLDNDSIQPERQDVSRVKTEAEIMQEALIKAVNDYNNQQDQITSATGASKRYVDKIQLRQKEEREIKKEHDSRRDIILYERKRLQEELARNNCHKHVTDYIKKKSLEEQVFKQHIEDTFRAKELILHNQTWVQRENEGKLERDAHSLVQINSTMREFFNKQSQNWIDYMASQVEVAEQVYKQQKHKKHLAYCRTLAEQIVEMSLDIATYKAGHGGNIPHGKIAELSLLFLKGYPLESVKYIQPSSIEIRNESTGADTEHFPIDRMLPNKSILDGPQNIPIDDNEFEAYLAAHEPWKYDKDAVKNNDDFQAIVDKLDSILRVVEPKNTMEKLSPANVKIALLGKPFSGKSWLARQIADSCRIKILDPVEVVTEYINFSKQKDSYQTPFEQSKIELGKTAAALLAGGSQLDDNLMNAIISNEIKNAGNDGFVLVDYPKTREQAALIEKEITGYEEVKAVKGGAGAKGKAPPPKPVAADPNLHSFLDFVFVLNIDNEVAGKRFAGRRVDPVTQRIYNLDFDPPGDDEHGVLQRLIAPDVPSEVSIQMRNHLFEDNLETLKEWFVKFGNMQMINSNDEHEKVRSQLESTIADFISSHKNRVTATVNNEDAEISVKRKATNNSIVKLIQMWHKFYESYEAQLKKSFGTLRKNRELVDTFFQGVKLNFGKFLLRGDRKQPLVDNFVRDYNLPETVKANLKPKSDELREKLFEICDQRRDFSEADRIAIVQYKWVEERLLDICNAYLGIAQAEFDKFAYKCHILGEYQKILANHTHEIEELTDIDKMTLIEKADGYFFDEILKAKLNANNPGGAQAANATPSKDAPLTKDAKPAAAGGKKDAKVPVAKKGDVVQEKTSSEPGIEVFKAEETVLATMQVHSAEKLLNSYIEPNVPGCAIEKANYLIMIQGLKSIVSGHIKSLKATGLELFAHIDEAIGSHYRAEIDAVKAFILYTNERIIANESLSPISLEGKIFEIKQPQVLRAADAPVISVDNNNNNSQAQVALPAVPVSEIKPLQ